MDGLYIFELNLVFLIYENNRLYFWLFSSFIFIHIIVYENVLIYDNLI